MLRKRIMKKPDLVSAVKASGDFCKLDTKKLFSVLSDLSARNNKLPFPKSKGIGDEPLDRLYEAFYKVYHKIIQEEEFLWFVDNYMFQDFIKELYNNKIISKTVLCKIVELVNDVVVKQEKNHPRCRQIEYKHFGEPFNEFYCVELPLEKVKYIIGPCTYYQFKLGNRNIYLFGEQHYYKGIDSHKVNASNSLIFPSFVYSLVSQNPLKTYDFMFENVSFFEKENVNELLYTYSPIFNALVEQFKNCINYTKRDLCPYNNLRVHYIDYRKSSSAKQKQIMSQSAIEKLIESKAEKNPSLEREFEEYYILPSEIPTIKKKILSMLESPKMIKQISAIKDEHIKKSLIKFLNIEIHNRGEDLKLEGKDIFIISYVSLVMDMYGLARLLRDFDPDVKKPYKSGFRGTSKNVIYYACSAHIRTMVKFFTEYLGLVPEIKIEYKDFCKSYLELNIQNTSFIQE